MDPKLYAHYFARKFDGYRKFEGLVMMTRFIASCFSLSVAVFLRRDFGERYIGWVNLYIAYGIVSNMAFFSFFAGRGFGWGMSWLTTLVWLGFIGMASYHRYVIWQKNKAGEQWHSYYSGTSRLPFKVSDEVMLKWVEPACVYVAGAVLKPFCPPVGMWLQISGMCMWLHASISFYYQHKTVLDALDAGLEAKHLSGAVAGRPARETAGITMAQSLRKRVQDSPDVQVMLGGLTPELRDLVTRK